MSDSAMEVPAWHVRECGSTQDIGRGWLAQACGQRAAAFVADRQLGGRGRQGRQWINAPGSSLLATIALRGPFDPSLAHDLATRSANGLRDALLRGGCDAATLQLKPPNDLVAGGHKLAGVLVDAQFTGVHADWLLVGMGVNLTGPPFGAGRWHATSIEAACGLSFEARSLCELVVPRIAQLVQLRVGRVAWQHAPPPAEVAPAGP